MEIIERRSHFIITDYTLKDSPSLESSLLIWQVGVKYPTDKLFHYDANKKELRIPRGIGRDFLLYRLKCDSHYIEDSQVIDETNVFVSTLETSFRLKDNIFVKDDIQESSIDFLTKETSPQLMLALDVGFGKTFCSIISTYKIGLVPLVILRSNWIEQWMKEFEKYTDLEDEDFFTIVGSDSITKLIKKNKKHEVYLASIDTLVSYMESGKSLDDLFDKLGIGIKIYDEAHKNFLSIMKIDENSNVKHTWYLTATPGRSSYSEDKTYKKIFLGVPMFGEHTSILKQYYNIKEIMYDTKPDPNIITVCSTSRGFNSILYSTYIFSSKPRIIFLLSLIIKYTSKLIETDPEARALILLDRLIDIDLMSKLLEKRTRVSIGKYCGLIKNSTEREEQLKKQIIFSTLGSVGVAKNIENLRVILPFANFSSSIIVRQLMGRLRYIHGKMVYYFNPIDIGFPAIIGQARVRGRELKIRSNTYEKINIDMDSEIKSFIEEDFISCSDVFPNNSGVSTNTYRFNRFRRKKPKIKREE